MNNEKRSMYIDYISAGLRYAQAEIKCKWPETEIIIYCQSYSPLADITQILGFPIYITLNWIEYDFALAIKDPDKNSLSLLKAFYEYQSLYSIGESATE